MRLPKPPGGRSGGGGGGPSGQAPGGAAPPRTPPPASVISASTTARIQAGAAASAGAGSQIPSDPLERIRLLLVLSSRISDLLERETAATRARRWNDLSALQGEKRALVRRYDELARLVRLNRDALIALPPELLERLVASTEHLDTLAHDSAIFLDRSAEAQRRVVDVTVRTTTQHRSAANAYIRARSPGPTHGGIPLSMTFNQRL